MKVLLNGESFEVEENSSIVDLLKKLDISGNRVAVEVNMEIVPKGDYTTFKISPDDKIEIVHFVGGG